MTDAIDVNLKMQFLRKQVCFSELTHQETEMLASLLSEKLFKAGETIVSEGDLVDSVYLIISGTADVRHIVIKNNIPQSNSLAKLHAGDAIGLNETGFYSLSGLRTASVVAETDMVLLRLSVAAFHGFALNYPHVNEIMRKNAGLIVDSEQPKP